jgi:hypothetical protein
MEGMMKQLSYLIIAACVCLPVCVLAQSRSEVKIKADSRPVVKNTGVKPTQTTPSFPKHETPTWDFGKVKEGEVAKHIFVLKNDTGRPVSIKHVSTSCGCTASTASKSEILPSGTTDITVSFNSKKYRSGPVRQTVFVNTGDSEYPLIRLMVRAEVVKE